MCIIILYLQIKLSIVESDHRLTIASYGSFNLDPQCCQVNGLVHGVPTVCLT